MELRPAERNKELQKCEQVGKSNSLPTPLTNEGPLFIPPLKRRLESLTEGLNRGRNALLGSVCLESPGFILEQTRRGATGS